jgi:hypothetical protein
MNAVVEILDADMEAAFTALSSGFKTILKSLSQITPIWRLHQQTILAEGSSSHREQVLKALLSLKRIMSLNLNMDCFKYRLLLELTPRPMILCSTRAVFSTIPNVALTLIMLFSL